jgi:hypothetical protein
MKKTKNGPAKTDKNGDTQNGDDFTSMRETVTNKIPIQAFPSLPAGRKERAGNRPPLLFSSQ